MCSKLGMKRPHHSFSTVPASDFLSAVPTLLWRAVRAPSARPHARRWHGEPCAKRAIAPGGPGLHYSYNLPSERHACHPIHHSFRNSLEKQSLLEQNGMEYLQFPIRSSRRQCLLRKTKLTKNFSCRWRDLTATYFQWRIEQVKYYLGRHRYGSGLAWAVFLPAFRLEPTEVMI